MVSIIQFIQLTSGNSIEELYAFLVIAKIVIDMLLRNVENIILAKPIIPPIINRVGMVGSTRNDEQKNYASVYHQTKYNLIYRAHCSVDNFQKTQRDE